jgi:dipeptidyl aminopeptidase/acylaminoacyl peptidase
VAHRGQREIYVIGAQGGQPQRLTFNESDDAGPSWSRDGKSIYITSNRSGQYEVWKIPAAGGAAQQVTIGGGFYPRESPDRRFVYFTKHGAETSLWRISTQGGRESRVLDRLFQLAGFVVVEDGLYFVRLADASRPSVTPEFELCFLEDGGGRVRQIAALSGPLGWGLSVAPDRRSVLFVRNNPGTLDLKAFNLPR